MITPQTVLGGRLVSQLAEVDDEESDYGAGVRPVNPPTNCRCSAKTGNQEEVKTPQNS